MKKGVMRLMAVVMIIAVAGMAFGADKAKGRAVKVVEKEAITKQRPSRNWGIQVLFHPQPSVRTGD